MKIGEWLESVTIRNLLILSVLVIISLFIALRASERRSLQESAEAQEGDAFQHIKVTSTNEDQFDVTPTP
ncbi:MAG: hypothetical protein ACE5DQ_00115 [Candidatus Paceibacterota bacterium]